MELSKEGAMELVGHVGIVLTRYRNNVNIWTLGVGHTRHAGVPDPRTFARQLTVKEALELFIKDIRNFSIVVRDVLKVNVSQTEFDALVSFHFNTSGIRRAALVKSLNRGDRELATHQFLNWRRPPELIGQRKKEQKLFGQGIYSNRRHATVFRATSAGRVLRNQGTLVNLEDHF